ncbi:hypothetical protein KP509_38G011900 [Ceratopteris richardii]|uniref:Uncharacterized protein n=1 Tax=Ceratopteris richardii TaxID=49495 RepID=A0A8T2Q1N6_CERRI|nr:hypothetical protein KP509_38G011900 [Ceratopteris richardii]
MDSPTDFRTSHAVPVTVLLPLLTDGNEIARLQISNQGSFFQQVSSQGYMFREVEKVLHNFSYIVNKDEGSNETPLAISANSSERQVLMKEGEKEGRYNFGEKCRKEENVLETQKEKERANRRGSANKKTWQWRGVEDAQTDRSLSTERKEKGTGKEEADDRRDNASTRGRYFSLEAPALPVTSFSLVTDFNEALESRISLRLGKTWDMKNILMSRPVRQSSCGNPSDILWSWSYEQKQILLPFQEAFSFPSAMSVVDPTVYHDVLKHLSLGNRQIWLLNPKPGVCLKWRGISASVQSFYSFSDGLRNAIVAGSMFASIPSFLSFFDGLRIDITTKSVNFDYWSSVSSFWGARYLLSHKSHVNLAGTMPKIPSICSVFDIRGQEVVSLSIHAVRVSSHNAQMLSEMAFSISASQQSGTVILERTHNETVESAMHHRFMQCELEYVYNVQEKQKKLGETREEDSSSDDEIIHAPCTQHEGEKVKAEEGCFCFFICIPCMSFMCRRL